MIELYLRTLEPPFSTFLKYHDFKYFKGIVTVEKIIERDFQSVSHVMTTGPPPSQEVNEVQAAYQQVRPSSRKRPVPPSQLDRWVMKKFTPLPMPLSQLLPQLAQEGYLVPLQPKPDVRATYIPKPLPQGFRLNKFCDYHQKTGHPTDQCVPLRLAIQNLIDSGIF
uniref:Uncharacterized protein n=1 Tax=Nelumbo nucifera TaxID=4432 RepID=A0A822YA13_NELNU|nr:TPA_asm: hypothetical protein HUJ06_030715 [Nelumbo nucifera]